MTKSNKRRLAKPSNPASRLNARILRVTQRLSAVKSHEGSAGKMLRKCLKALQRSGFQGVREYLKHVESGNLPEVSEEFARQIFEEQQSELSSTELAKRIKQLRRQPLISVIIPVYQTPVEWLSRSIESLQKQAYGNWELCAVDDCSPTEEQREVLRRYATRDPRVRFHFSPKSQGISESSNLALSMAQGEYVALLGHASEITSDAFYWMMQAINDNTDADFLYSDECKIDDTPSQRLSHFVFKPEWSPEIMFNGMLTGNLSVYETEFIRCLGGFRKNYDFSQDYDLALRAAERAKKIVHVERVLYLWRAIPGSAAVGGRDFARDSNIAALQEHLARQGIEGLAIALPHANRVAVTPKKDTKVSIIIPSESYENLTLAIGSITTKTAFQKYEVVAVCNTPLADKLARIFSNEPHIVFSKYDKKNNFSDKCNQGARDSSGDILIFYNDDVLPINSDWLSNLIEYLDVPGVGGTSPKLLYKNQSIQYAGTISGTPGFCGTAFHHIGRDSSDPFLSMHKYVRNVSVLSGACCAIKKDLFFRVGEFDPINTPHRHSDMDLSYKIMEAGYRCVYTPYSELLHIGHGSRHVKNGEYKADIFALKRWGSRISNDPYFTATMKRVLYREFNFKYKIYAEHLNPTRSYTGPDVLFVAHELSLTGAPRMLIYAAKAILDQGGFPVVVAPSDGPLREELTQAGIAVIVDESITDNHFLFGSFAKNFDTIIINTMILDKVVRQLQKFKEPNILWWLHEAQALKEALGNRTDIDTKRVQVLCVSEYAKKYVPTGYNVNVLYNGIPDEKASPPPQGGAFTFLVAGTIEPRKGQDIFAEAILLLPYEIRAACRFVISGKLWEEHKPFWEQITKKTKGKVDIEYVGLLEHQKALECTAAADVVVCCSRDESFSLTVAEAAMLSKPAIVNANVGISDVLEKECACIMSAVGNAASLASKMIYAFEHRDEIVLMGKRARIVYEREFTIERFADNLRKVCMNAPDIQMTHA